MKRAYKTVFLSGIYSLRHLALRLQLGLELGRSFLKAGERGRDEDDDVDRKFTFYYFIVKSNQVKAYALNIYPMD